MIWNDAQLNNILEALFSDYIIKSIKFHMQFGSYEKNVSR